MSRPMFRVEINDDNGERAATLYVMAADPATGRSIVSTVLSDYHHVAWVGVWPDPERNT